MFLPRLKFSELEGKAENEMFKSSPNLSATADSC